MSDDTSPSRIRMRQRNGKSPCSHWHVSPALSRVPCWCYVTSHLPRGQRPMTTLIGGAESRSMTTFLIIVGLIVVVVSIMLWNQR
jgi:hypothetical protein